MNDSAEFPKYITGYDPVTKMVSIPLEQYNRLVQAAASAGALQDAGADNWSGYDYAMNLLYGEDDDD